MEKEATNQEVSPEHHNRNGGTQHLKAFALDCDSGEHSSQGPPRDSREFKAVHTSRLKTDAAAASPLQHPTLRVQGEDIILEEGSVPVLDGVDGHFESPSVHREPSSTNQALDGDRQVPSRITLTTAMAQLNSMSRTHGDTLEMKATSGKGSQALHTRDGELRVGSSHSSEGPSRVAKLPSTLTLENVAQMNKLGQPLSKLDPNTRMWHWLDDAGPPYDVSPSLAVGGVTKSNGSQVNRGSLFKGLRKYFCFSCAR